LNQLKFFGQVRTLARRERKIPGLPCLKLLSAISLPSTTTTSSKDSSKLWTLITPRRKLTSMTSTRLVIKLLVLGSQLSKVSKKTWVIWTLLSLKTWLYKKNKGKCSCRCINLGSKLTKQPSSKQLLTANSVWHLQKLSRYLRSKLKRKL
jgi:hypothetical protein